MIITGKTNALNKKKCPRNLVTVINHYRKNLYKKIAAPYSIAVQE
jgi:uncharacterized protein YdbL (DUF1318 family)